MGGSHSKPSYKTHAELEAHAERVRLKAKKVVEREAWIRNRVARERKKWWNAMWLWWRGRRLWAEEERRRATGEELRPHYD